MHAGEGHAQFEPFQAQLLEQVGHEPALVALVGVPVVGENEVQPFDGHHLHDVAQAVYVLVAHAKRLDPEPAYAQLPLLNERLQEVAEDEVSGDEREGLVLGVHHEVAREVDGVLPCARLRPAHDGARVHARLERVLLGSLEVEGIEVYVEVEAKVAEACEAHARTSRPFVCCNLPVGVATKKGRHPCRMPPRSRLFA